MIAVLFFDDTHAVMREWSREFSAKYTRYLRDGEPDWPHICKAIESCGFGEVTAQNISHVKIALVERAERKQAAQNDCIYPDYEGGLTRGKHSFDRDGYCNVCGMKRAQS